MHETDSGATAEEVLVEKQGEEWRGFTARRVPGELYWRVEGPGGDGEWGYFATPERARQAARAFARAWGMGRMSVQGDPDE